jgi:phage host-nuclease inhibitor protein Gam
MAYSLGSQQSSFIRRKDMRPTIAALKGVRIPRTRAEAAQAITRLGMALAKMRSVSNKYEVRIQKKKEHIIALEKERDEILKPLNEESRTVATAVHRYAEEHRSELTNNGKLKTVKLDDKSSFRWFLPGKSSLVVDETRFYEEVADKGLESLFVRVIKEPNKQAMHDNPEEAAKLTSVSTERKERFQIEPRNVDIRVERKLHTEHVDWEFKEMEK